MLAKVHTFSVVGIDALQVEIEVDVSNGLPNIAIVGLPDSTIKESKERVRSGLKNSEFTYPADKITVNLAPANVKKEGSSFDLAIALGILAASKQIDKTLLEGYFFIGELSLNGELRPVKGALSMALAMRKKRSKKLILPLDNANEAAVVKEIKVYGIKTLRELVAFLYDPNNLSPYINCNSRHSKDIGNSFADELDFCDVKGQWAAKRALEVTAGGMHNILLIGPPGSGKTMLAKRMTSILPPLNEDEALETTKIHSSAGQLDSKTGLLHLRPFRSPHHTISNTALVGGGTIPQAGEISLAHNGVLFLDELPEFHRDVLEVLRQPLEDGQIRVARAARSLSFPARFMLVCAMNPCPCGHFGQPHSNCSCSPRQIHRYRSKISGPLLDRIDIHMEVPSLKYQELTDDTLSENSHSVKTRVLKCHAIQRERFKKEGILFNASMNHRQTRKYCALDKECSGILKAAIEELRLSTRGYDKILKVARTISDLAGKENIKASHVAEAIQYRSLDRQTF
ncbi:MAG: YifB family Mg chelatase-like AAA ATPase [Candidatus Omnitrophica bacterium]|nr:YifB family Mg chelatase-like AAA ATPase [Candidatus Omnitrophota bacterium]